MATIHHVECPFCKGVLTVDAATGMVVGSEKNAAVAESGDQLASALKKLSQEKKTRHERFEEAKHALAHQHERLEHTFKDELKKVSEEPEPNAPPIRPIDLD